MTEDEARTKWCPMVRTGLVAGMAVNHHVGRDGLHAGDVHDETRCVASECMMWRWAAKSTMKGPPSAMASVDQKDWKGYCGLAGSFSA